MLARSRRYAAWVGLGLAVGSVNGARLVSSNPSVRGGDVWRLAGEVAVLYAAAFLPVAALVMLASGWRRRPIVAARERGLRSSIVSAASFCVVGALGLAAVSSLAGSLLVVVAAFAVAVACERRDPGPQPIASVVIAVALGAVGWAGFTALSIARERGLPEYVEFRDTQTKLTGRVVLIGIDGADWSRIDALLEQGRLPALAGLIERGVRAPLATTSPTWSPILWTTIATGTLAPEHGVLDFAETPVPGLDRSLLRLRKSPLLPRYGGLGRLLRALYRLGWLEERPISSGHRRTKAVWNVVSDLGGRVGVVNWFASWPCEELNGFVVSDSNPKRAAFLQDRHGAHRATWDVTYPGELLAQLSELDSPVVGEDATAVLALPCFAELPADEYARLLEHPRLLGVFRHIYESDGFAAGAAQHLLEREALDLLAVYFSGVDNVSHRFGRVPGVVDRYYEYIDSLLSDLVAAAHPDTSFVIVSDHGFLYGDQDHFAHGNAPPGILILSGPGVRAGASLRGAASIVDIAPTLLRLMGVPLARGLAGEPLAAALEPVADPPREVEHYGSYAPPRTPAPSADDGVRQAEVMQKLRSLGYVE